MAEQAAEGHMVQTDSPPSKEDTSYGNAWSVLCSFLG